MIGVDVDQIYGILRLHISGIDACAIFSKDLVFSLNTLFIPKEIYNIISVTRISLNKIKKNKLVINDKIINLYNIRAIIVLESPNVIISRRILNLPLCDFFVHDDRKSGFMGVRRIDKNYEQYVIDNTTKFM